MMNNPKYGDISNSLIKACKALIRIKIDYGSIIYALVPQSLLKTLDTTLYKMRVCVPH